MIFYRTLPTKFRKTTTWTPIIQQQKSPKKHLAAFPPGAGVAEEIFPTQTGAPFLPRATGWIAKGVVFGARGEFMLWKQRPWLEKKCC